MSNSAHCRIINCESRLLVHFSKAPINLLNGTFACDDVSQEDGLRLRANILSLPVSAKFISVHRHFTVSQGFAHELLYQANNRAAEVTMYGEMEVYTKTTTE
jgi:pantoate kinase